MRAICGHSLQLPPPTSPQTLAPLQPRQPLHHGPSHPRPKRRQLAIGCHFDSPLVFLADSVAHACEGEDLVDHQWLNSRPLKFCLVAEFVLDTVR